MNKSNLNIMEYKRNIEADINGNVVTYNGVNFIARNVNFKAGDVELYSTLESEQPCHIVEIELVEFI